MRNWWVGSLNPYRLLRLTAVTGPPDLRTLVHPPGSHLSAGMLTAWERKPRGPAG